MLTIRLHRTGKRHQPQFRIVLAEKQKHPSKKFIEILGTYNPRNKEFAVKSEERIQYWISQHVELSPTVQNLFVGHNLLKDGSKVQAWKPKKKSISAEASTDVKTSTVAKAMADRLVDKSADSATAKTVAPEAEGSSAPAAKSESAETVAEAPTEAKAEEPKEEAVPAEKTE